MRPLTCPLACSLLTPLNTRQGDYHRTHTELAAMRRRFGWRRLRVLLSREGVHMNHKKLRRLYVEERLQVRRNPPRRVTVIRRKYEPLP